MPLCFIEPQEAIRVVAESVGRERSTVTNLLRLLQLPASVQRLVSEGMLSMGHARAILGLGRTGSFASNGSGDYVIAFSTATSVRRSTAESSQQVTALSNETLTPLFQAVAEATEEAILNSLFRAESASYGERTVEALPLERVLEILDRYRAR